MQQDSEFSIIYVFIQLKSKATGQSTQVKVETVESLQSPLDDLKFSLCLNNTWSRKFNIQKGRNCCHMMYIIS